MCIEPLLTGISERPLPAVVQHKPGGGLLYVEGGSSVFLFGTRVYYCTKHSFRY